MRELQPLLFQPVVSKLGFSLTSLAEEVRAVHFDGLVDEVEVRWHRRGPLAYILTDHLGPARHVVCFHPVLNHEETPEPVLRFLTKHELTHIIRPPRLIDWVWDAHPDEFWEYEDQIAPERYAARDWLYGNLVRTDCTKPFGYRLKRGWRELNDGPRTGYNMHLPLEPERFERICPGGQAQLRFPPEWLARPLP
jgi:hypothetical protein